MPHRAASEGSPAPPAVGAAGARLEPLLPTGKKPGRPSTWSKRQLINEIRWWTRTGAPWRDMPARYRPWQTVYGLFRRWQRDGTWQPLPPCVAARAGWDCRRRRRGPQVRQERGRAAWINRAKRTARRGRSTPKGHTL
jgi:transposase